MAVFRERDKQHFPLKNIASVVGLFRDQLESKDGPNLAILSIVLGAIENALTVTRAGPQRNIEESSTRLETIVPVIELSTIEILFKRFVTIVKGSVDLTQYPSKYATRGFVKNVSDVIWSYLARSNYKDKAHLQSLYSFLTENKLDCVGVSVAVVAACQVLGFDDVHLVLSEDHSWVAFGEHGEDTTEVTWHGKGHEDKRGQPVTTGISEKRWLYLNGRAVVCRRATEVASIVSAINHSINATMHSCELGYLQQELLWLLYDKKHLDKYPMALGNLGDLEEMSPSPGRPSPIHLYNQAVSSSRQFYGGMHVYPYTYLGNYFNRKLLFKDALRNWAGAAEVIKQYNYHREDEEIYKDFLEISNEFIPNIIKTVDRPQESGVTETSRSDAGSGIPFLKDPECYAMILKFCDGICGWEEGGSTPVLHVMWAQFMVFSLSKFSASVRAKLKLEAEGEDEKEKEPEKEHPKKAEKSKPKMGRGRPKKDKKTTGSQISDSQKTSQAITAEKPDADSRTCSTVSAEGCQNGTNKTVTEKEQANDNRNLNEDKIKSTIEELASKVGDESENEAPNPKLEALAHACRESILNKDYLLGVGEPFASTCDASSSNYNTASDTRVDYNEFLSSRSNGTPFPGMTMDSVLKAETPTDLEECKRSDREEGPENVDTEHANNIMEASTSLMLHSAKMKGLKTLLTNEKLNTFAIKLQLTAQSQVSLKHTRVGSNYELGMQRKRLRRD